ncbi:hypothetical protein PAXINDRAFT_14509 [Paxillus involutus ATCC 200175]|uniref:Uncharacterized protein n=1 Tax=Paxillus involutus ATCC 200175 TaxID=664439 RepID=A0A0C9TZP2_PAXIN|nr:hypothetical protein PAXINDRAFT_14509 [Paxillus involutus ATCC 200175]
MHVLTRKVPATFRLRSLPRSSTSHVPFPTAHVRAVLSRPHSAAYSSIPPSTPPTPTPIRNKWSALLRLVGRVTLVAVIGGMFYLTSVSFFASSAFILIPFTPPASATGTFYYIAHKERNPGPQLPFDPSKKTLVILGSGWGATSLLKRLDTEDYNTIVISPKNFFLLLPSCPRSQWAP